MMESLNAIRSLGLAPVFEDLYFGRKVPGDIGLYLRYPDMFRNATDAPEGPLTAAGLVPIVADGNGDTVCFYDPRSSTFVLKSIEEPEQVERQFASWQQYLAYRLLEIADSGASDEEVAEVALATAFTRTEELLELLEEMESLTDQQVERRTGQFIEDCKG